ncbi:MAG: hypothetical protein HLUCCA12_05375 [Rhodobacteraceae bacterium HLUCCA12]|nr:MAG: hypothetical protein HLUCCA12_05375 [Rhodobacteraceae bacterium HLUCCA12]
MSVAVDIEDLARQVTGLMRRRLGARGQTLEAALRQRGRHLPRNVRRAADDLAQAEAMAGHPRLRRRLDDASLRRSGRVVLDYLRPLGAAERRWQFLLSVAGSIAFALLVTGVGLIAVLVWRGYL